MTTCPTCGYRAIEGHECPPLWAVEVISEKSRIVQIYARSSKEAVERGVRKIDGGHFWAKYGNVVDVLASHQDMTRRFRVKCDLKPVYEATDHTPLPDGVAEEEPVRMPKFLKDKSGEWLTDDKPKNEHAKFLGFLTDKSKEIVK